MQERGREIRGRKRKNKGEKKRGEGRVGEGGREAKGKGGEGRGEEGDWQVNKQVCASVSLGESRGVGMEGWLAVGFFVTAGREGGSEGRGKEERTKVEGERGEKGEKKLQVE